MKQESTLAMYKEKGRFFLVECADFFSIDDRSSRQKAIARCDREFFFSKKLRVDRADFAIISLSPHDQDNNFKNRAVSLGRHQRINSPSKEYAIIQEEEQIAS